MNKLILNDMIRVQYKCFKHQDKEIEFYCGTDQSFICSLCHAKHSEHNTQPDLCTKLEITEQFILLKDRIGVLIKNAKLKLSHINNILEKKPQMDSKLLKKSIQESVETLVLPHIKEGDADYEKVTRYYLKKEDPLKIDSLILKNSISLKSLQTYLGNQLIKENLWRGTRDGFTARNFHSKCDDKGKTLTVIKTERGSVFGGYTDISWKSSGGWASGTKNSFIFLIQQDETAAVGKCSDASEEVHHESNYGPTFGGGHELYTSNNCNTYSSSYTYCSGTYYEKINGLQHLDQGNQRFQVQEIEVFLVQ